MLIKIYASKNYLMNNSKALSNIFRKKASILIRRLTLWRLEKRMMTQATLTYPTCTCGWIIHKFCILVISIFIRWALFRKIQFEIEWPVVCKKPRVYCIPLHKSMLKMFWSLSVKHFIYNEKLSSLRIHLLSTKFISWISFQTIPSIFGKFLSTSEEPSTRCLDADTCIYITTCPTSQNLEIIHLLLEVR